MAADIRLVRPVPGRRVRTNAKGAPLLPDAGASVAWNSYWQRRLAAGDIEVVPDAPAPAPAAVKAPPAFVQPAPAKEA